MLHATFNFDTFRLEDFKPCREAVWGLLNIIYTFEYQIEITPYGI